MPISLSDSQLDLVAQGARQLPLEKRPLYLERVGAELLLRCGPRRHLFSLC